MMRIASAHLWVHDQEVALKFWTEKVGMEVREDVSLPEEIGDFRWLTVGPPGQDDVSIVLMAVPGEPVMDEATRKQVLDLTAKGFAGHRLPHHRGHARPRTKNEGPRRRVHRTSRTRCPTASTADSAIRRATACDSPNWRRCRPILGRCEPPPQRSGRRPSSSAAPGTFVGLGPWLITHWEIPGSSPPLRVVLGRRAHRAGPDPAGPRVHPVRQGRRNADARRADRAARRHRLQPIRPQPDVRRPADRDPRPGTAFRQHLAVVYAVIGWIATASFVQWYEEPTLVRTYGEQYEEYRRNVPAWTPRLTPWNRRIRRVVVRKLAASQAWHCRSSAMSSVRSRRSWLMGQVTRPAHIQLRQAANRCAIAVDSSRVASPMTSMRDPHPTVTRTCVRLCYVGPTKSHAAARQHRLQGMNTRHAVIDSPLGELTLGRRRRCADRRVLPPPLVPPADDTFGKRVDAGIGRSYSPKHRRS